MLSRSDIYQSNLSKMCSNFSLNDEVKLIKISRIIINEPPHNYHHVITLIWTNILWKSILLTHN